MILPSKPTQTSHLTHDTDHQKIKNQDSLPNHQQPDKTMSHTEEEQQKAFDNLNMSYVAILSKVNTFPSEKHTMGITRLEEFYIELGNVVDQLSDGLSGLENSNMQSEIRTWMEVLESAKLSVQDVLDSEWQRIIDEQMEEERQKEARRMEEERALRTIQEEEDEE